MKRASNPMRAFLAGAFLLVGALMVPISLVSTWLRASVLDTGGFVELYTPVAGKSDFQSYLASQVASTTTSVVADSGLLDGVASTTSGAASSADEFLAQFGVDLNLTGTASTVSATLRTALEQKIYEQTLPAVQSSQFRAAWGESLQQLHSQVVAALDGTSDGSLSLQAGPFVSMLKTSLQEQGFTLASFIPTPGSNVAIPLATIEQNEQAQNALSLLDRYGPWLPWATAGFLLLGFIFAQRHVRAVAITGLGIAILCGALWLALPAAASSLVATSAAAEDSKAMVTLLWQVGTAPLQSMAALTGVAALAVSGISFVLHLLTRRHA